MNFGKNLQHDFPKMRGGGVNGRSELFRKFIRFGRDKLACVRAGRGGVTDCRCCTSPVIGSWYFLLSFSPRLPCDNLTYQKQDDHHTDDGYNWSSIMRGVSYTAFSLCLWCDYHKYQFLYWWLISSITERYFLLSENSIMMILLWWWIQLLEYCKTSPSPPSSP